MPNPKQTTPVKTTLAVKVDSLKFEITLLKKDAVLLDSLNKQYSAIVQKQTESQMSEKFFTSVLSTQLALFGAVIGLVGVGYWFANRTYINKKIRAIKSLYNKELANIRKEYNEQKTATTTQFQQLEAENHISIHAHNKVMYLICSEAEKYLGTVKWGLRATHFHFAKIDSFEDKTIQLMPLHFTVNFLPKIEKEDISESDLKEVTDLVSKIKIAMKNEHLIKDAEKEAECIKIIDNIESTLYKVYHV